MSQITATVAEIPFIERSRAREPEPAPAARTILGIGFDAPRDRDHTIDDCEVSTVPAPVTGESYTCVLYAFSQLRSKRNNL